MPVFEYHALDRKGRKKKGLIDADGSKAAKAALRHQGLFPVELKEVSTPAEASKSSVFPSFSRVKSADISMMTRQLSTLVSAGFQLTPALNTLLPQIKKESLKKIISKIKDTIEEGSSFANALSQHPGVFSPIYVNMVKAGEASGTLSIVLERLADISEKQDALGRKMKSALAYPLLMTLIGSAVLFFLMTVIVPNITAIFDQMDHTLPWTTQTLIRLSNWLSRWWIFLGAGILLAVYGFIFIRKQPKIRKAMDRALLRLPYAGDLMGKLSLARLTRTLGSLLENGVPLLNALEIAKNVTGNMEIESAVNEAVKEVERGRELGQVMSEHACFPYLAVQMIKVGEQSGNLEPMLKKTARVYDNEIETTVMGLTALMEPLIILVMAVVVGFIVLSVCLPIFEMNQLVQ